MRNSDGFRVRNNFQAIISLRIPNKTSSKQQLSLLKKMDISLIIKIVEVKKRGIIKRYLPPFVS